jgi:sugar phosphate isomerase/epimerase
VNEFGVYNFVIETRPATDQATLLAGLGFEGVAFWHPLSLYAPNEQVLDHYRAHPAVAAGQLRLHSLLYQFDGARLNRNRLRRTLDSTAQAGSVAWLLFGNSLPMSRDELLAAVRDISDIAAAADGGKGVTVVLYPHAGHLMPSAESALEVIQAVGRDNLKLSLHLSHELKAGNQNRLAEVIARTAPYAALASINGADIQREERQEDYSHSIRPLGEGDLDVETLFLRPLLESGYTGPIVLHTHWTPGPADERLRASIERWRQMVAAYEALPAL